LILCKNEELEILGKLEHSNIRKKWDIDEQTKLALRYSARGRAIMKKRGATYAGKRLVKYFKGTKLT